MQKAHIVGVITPQVLENIHAQSDPLLSHEIAACSFLEIRYDLFPDRKMWTSLARTVQALQPKAKIIATLRLACDGGRIPDQQAAARWGDWKRILKAKVAPHWIDVEQSLLVENKPLLTLAKNLGVKVIASCHDFQKVPHLTELLEAVGNVRQYNVGGFKVAAMSMQAGDCKALYQLAREQSKGFTLFSAFAMGESGKRSRLHSFTCGANLSYGALGKGVAPGQIPVAIMNLWKHKKGLV